jgi:para-aminobenzoate synthetase/4-amino-4-deoxychorismate lyase
MPSPSALIDFSGPHADLRPIRLAFGRPQEELVARNFGEVLPVLEAVEERGRRGYWCVGYLRYEAAAAFDEKFAVHTPDASLAYFSIHQAPVPWPDMAHDINQSLRWERAPNHDEFDRHISTIRDAIESGEVYQVNYTGRFTTDYVGDPFDLFCSLRRSQPNSNAAFIANAEEQVLSVSPELFFDWDGNKLTCAPMKGTAPRGSTPEADLYNVRELRGNPKERAENVMIVDLIRNDVSRIAQLGSVEVKRLFECQAWPTVWQMTSEVVARTREGTTLSEVLRSLFPCGSITGAPKHRAMHWIRKLECAPRGVYCGAVGVVRPGGAARFNVPIRTVEIRAGRASCGIGSGITWSSSAPAEWCEWQHKSDFLDQASHPFELLQTLRVESGECRHLELHLDRLGAASAHFGFPFDRGVVRDKIVESVRPTLNISLAPAARLRVRIDCRGIVTIDVSPVPHDPAHPAPVKLAPQPIRAAVAFLRHKTTRREHYEAFEAGTESAFDSLLWNARGELTEFTRGSVVIERDDGDLVTPSLASGLLDGVGRALALAAGRVREDVVRVSELALARRVWFVNALRGWIEVRIDPGLADRNP